MNAAEILHLVADAIQRADLAPIYGESKWAVAERALRDAATKCDDHATPSASDNDHYEWCDDDDCQRCLHIGGIKASPPSASEVETGALERVETGVVQFDDDWPGVFIRGDNAFHFAMQLRAMLIDSDKTIEAAVLRSLADLLASCDARNGGSERARKIAIRAAKAQPDSLLAAADALRAVSKKARDLTHEDSEGHEILVALVVEMDVALAAYDAARGITQIMGVEVVFVPWMKGVLLVPEWNPPRNDPHTGQGTGESMKINLIWVCESSPIDDSPYIVEAWDEFTIGENEDGWADAVKDANKKYGAENVRIMAVSIPSAAVRKLWDVPVVTAKVGK